MAPHDKPQAASGSRLLGWLRGLVGRRSPMAPPPPPLSSPSLPRRAPSPSDVEWLATYLRRLGVLDERPRAADPQAVLALQRLAQTGRWDEVIRLGTALATALPGDVEVQLLVGQLLWQQKLAATARPLLERLLERPLPDVSHQQRQRVRWLLGEIAEAAGEQATAVGLLTALLAEDWDYPGARSRLLAIERLIGLRDRDGQRLAAKGQLAAPAAAVMAAAPTLLGGTSGLHSRYRLRRELGCGASGSVYLADDLELGCEVALKLFHRQKPLPQRSPPLQGLEEARLLCSLRHPGVLAIYELAEVDAETRYLTMELCEGGSLRSRLQQGPLLVAVALRRAEELCETLAAVHGLGVVHGDLKPENLLFRSPQRSRHRVLGEPLYGDLVLSDFGAARRLTDGSQLAAAGTRGYLAPERLHGGPPSPAADLYSLGVILAELLTGQPPSQAPAQKLAVPLRTPEWLRLAASLGPRGQALHSLLEQLTSSDPAQRGDAARARAMLQELLELMLD